MRFASTSSLVLLLTVSVFGAAACGDDDAGTANTGGSAGKAGSSNEAGNESYAGETANGGGGGTAMAKDSQLCTDLGGPTGINAVVRGDGKTSASDPFNGFKFEHSGRQGSVLLNVATDPCIGQQFASLLTPARAGDLEHLAECLSLFVQNTAGCAVAYDMDKNGKACKSMKAAHLGRNISEDDYTALITDAATALIAAGVKPDSEQFKTVAMALTADSLKADVITNKDSAYSQPSAMCTAAGGDNAGGAGGASQAGGGAGAGGAP